MSVNLLGNNSDLGSGNRLRVWSGLGLTLLYGDKREGTWVVGLLRDEILDSRAIRRNLDSRVTSR